MTLLISEDCYYTYKGVHYSVYFPIIWAINNKPLTGCECPNCYTYSTEENKQSPITGIAPKNILRNAIVTGPYE